MNLKTLIYELSEDGIAVITLNRPDKLNAINDEMKEEFFSLSRELFTNNDVKVVIFTGKGKVFSAGGDIKFFEKGLSTVDYRIENCLPTNFFDDLEVLEKPVIAAINGPCTGAGLQITLSCDIRIASDRAEFGFRENNLGLIPGAGGCSRLVKLIGYGKAKELIFTGEMISAEGAKAIGLVNKVVRNDELLPEANQFAKRLLNRAPQALGLAKRILWNCVNADLQTGRVLESLAQSILIKTQDHQEGVRAFREKRKPEFNRE